MIGSQGAALSSPLHPGAGSRDATGDALVFTPVPRKFTAGTLTFPVGSEGINKRPHREGSRRPRREEVTETEGPADVGTQTHLDSVFPANQIEFLSITFFRN